MSVHAPWRHRGDVAVLLDRRVAGLEHHRQRMRHVADDAPRRAEVEQQRPGRGEQDVVGGDVAVEALGRVHHRQRVEQRRQPGAQLRLARRMAHLGERRLEGRALVERHRHVGGAVLLPEAIDLDQGRMVEAGEEARLVDEALQARLEGVEMALGLDHDRRRARDPRGHRRRHVLLDRDLALQRMVPGQVDDAEAALADQAGDLVVAQVGAERQRVAQRRGRRALGRRADDGSVVVVVVGRAQVDTPGGLTGKARS